MYAIVEHVDEHGHGPSMAELAVRIGCAPSSAHRLVEALREMGLIQSGYGRHRCTAPSDVGWAWMRTLRERWSDEAPGR